MTREEFIESYMRESQITDFSVEGEVVAFDDEVMLAVPCACEEPDCPGWQMKGPR